MISFVIVGRAEARLTIDERDASRPSR